MSESKQPQGDPEPRVPTDEQLREGFILEPTETVAFDIPTTDSARRIQSFHIGNGVEVMGIALAELQFGGNETYARGTVINTFDAGDGRRKDLLILDSSSDNTVFSASLTSGEMWGIGRGFEGQRMLPGTVSRDHCAIGMDENNKLVIENHNPSGHTAVRRIG